MCFPYGEKSINKKHESSPPLIGHVLAIILISGKCRCVQVRQKNEELRALAERKRKEEDAKQRNIEQEEEAEIRRQAQLQLKAAMVSGKLPVRRKQIHGDQCLVAPVHKFAFFFG